MTPTTMRTGVLVIAALVVGAGVVGAQEIPGCYDLTLGGWSYVEGSNRLGRELEPPGNPFESEIYPIPYRTRLEEPERSWHTEGMVSVPANALQVSALYPRWSQAGDTLKLFFGNGHSGVQFTMLAAPSGWAGRGQTFVDNIGEPLWSLPVTFERVDCDSPPPVPASADPALPRTLELADDWTVTLAEPLPAGMPVAVKDRWRWDLTLPTEGLWAGADSVWVRRNQDGVVPYIRIYFSKGVDLDPLVTHINEEFMAHRDLPAGTQSLLWENRTTRILLRRWDNLPFQLVEISDLRIR